MGWWAEYEKEQELIIGDELLDAAGQMLDTVFNTYQEEMGRKLTLRELGKTLEIALSTRVSDFNDIEDENVQLLVALNVKKKPKKQPIKRGDYFSIPLPSGGYAFGRVEGIYRSILLLDYLEAYSDTPLSARELSKRRVMFRGLCGYLGLANWHWHVLGNERLPEIKNPKTTEDQLRDLMEQYPTIEAPLGDLPTELEKMLVRRRQIPGRKP